MVASPVFLLRLTVFEVDITCLQIDGIPAFEQQLDGAMALTLKPETASQVKLVFEANYFQRELLDTICVLLFSWYRSLL